MLGFANRQTWMIGLVALISFVGLVNWPDSAWAQVEGLFDDQDTHRMWRGPSGYFASYKLGIVVVVFTAWVVLADYANRDALRLEDHLKTKAEVWSPIYLAGVFFGLIAVLAIPWFWAGLPVFLLLAFAPLVAFFVVRNQQVEPEVRRTASVTGKISGPMRLVDGADASPIEFLPNVAGTKPAEIIFLARRSPVYGNLCQLCDDMIRRRAENAVILCTQEKAIVKMQIDGLWHQTAEMESAMGQGMISVAHILIGANPDLGKRAEAGQFGVKKERTKIVLRFTSTPTKTEYRAQFRVEAPADTVKSLAELGMRSDHLEKVRAGMAGNGVFVVAATSGQGSTTLWKACLNLTDRWTRDWYSVVPQSDHETMMENIKRMPHADGNVAEAIKILREIALKQAGGYAIPTLFDPKLVNELLQHSETEGRKILTRMPAKSAAEGLLRAYAAAGDRKAMAKHLRIVVYQRLVRKLCGVCREKQQIPPDTIRKLGGDPRAQDFLYVPKTIPDPLPKNYQACQVCADLGYMDRTGVFEVIEVNDAIRQVLLTKPKIEAITEVARKTGSLSLLQSAYPLLLNGTTSMEELKRACSA